MALKVSGGAAAKQAGLDLGRYDEAQLKKLNYVTDDKIDDTEAKAAVRVADANGDGFIDKTELKAFDYLLGKDTSLAGAKAFEKLYGDDRTGKLGKKVDGEYAKAQQQTKTADTTHYDEVDVRSRTLLDMGEALKAQGIEIRIHTEKQLLDEAAKLPPGPKREALEEQAGYAHAKEDLDKMVGKSWDTLEGARKTERSTKVETMTVNQLLAEAKSRAKTASAVTTAEDVGKVAAGMRFVREIGKKTPLTKGDAQAYAKALHIKNAVVRGDLDEKDVNLPKLNAAIARYEQKVNIYMFKLEQTAKKTVEYMESPEFKAAMDSLPADERAKLEGGLLHLVADTKAGQAYFDKNILPALTDSPSADPRMKKLLDGSEKSVKFGMEMLTAYGAHLIKKGGPQAMQLIDDSIAKVIGIDKKLMPKIYDAMEIANTKGPEAAKKFLEADKDIAKVAKNFEVVSKGVAALSVGLSAFEMMGDPNLRNGIALAKDAAELAGVLASASSSTSAIARYSRFAGKVAPALDIVVGGLDAKDAYDRGDTAGVVGGGMQALGGGMVLAAAATGVGLPLAVAGALVTAGGELVSYLWGDSASEKWMKANAREYMN